MECKIIRSRRKTISMEVTMDGLLIRAPLRTSSFQIEKFVSQHRKWAENHILELNETKRQLSGMPELTEKEIENLTKKAQELIPERVRYYAPKVGVTYNRITIRHQHTRWGSCSSQGNLSFNCLLMLTPPEVTDSVVVHELCHRKEMNHSKRFYDEVLRVFPEYWKCWKWLRDHGSLLMMRLKKCSTL